VSRSGEISAQTSGLALKNGRQGEVIKVQNASSQRVVSATVEAPGVVGVQ
jgi:flagella basal body P-ring formation protein FlgA